MEQIFFLDKFVVGYGFNGIADYTTEISQSNINDETELLKFVNKNMNNIKKLFKVSSLNLSRKEYKVDSVTLAFAVLKNLLLQANIPFELIHKKTGNVMRLIKQNKLLVKYIENQMTDIIQCTRTDKEVNRVNIIDGKDYISQLNLIDIDPDAIMKHSDQHLSKDYINQLKLIDIFQDTPTVDEPTMNKSTMNKSTMDMNESMMEHINKKQNPVVYPYAKTVHSVLSRENIEQKNQNVVFDFKRIYHLCDDKSLIIFLTKDTIGIEIPLVSNANLFEIIYNISTKIIVDGVIMKIVPIKSELILDDHIFLNLNDVTKEDPIFMLLLTMHSVKIKISLDRTDELIKTIINRNCCIKIEGKNILLQRTEKIKLFESRKVTFCGIEYNICDRAKGVITKNQDVKMTKFRKISQKSTLVLADRFCLHEITGIVKNIKVGVVNLDNFGEEKNKISYIDLKIGGKSVHTQRGDVENTNMIELKIDPIPSYALIYHEIELQFMTYGKLEPNTIIKIDYEVEFITKEQYSHMLKNKIAFMSGYVVSGLFLNSELPK